MADMMDFDILVVGGGHAGYEAAHAAARMGCSVAMITLDRTKIGQMSCNPSIGGIGKGHLVREIDALGGLMGQAADSTAIQKKMLNTSKGAAVQALRTQNDRKGYRTYIQERLFGLPALDLLDGEVTSVLIHDGSANGVELSSGQKIHARVVILSTGTFLKGAMFTGLTSRSGGRLGEDAAAKLSGSLISQGLILKRLKTGTPPRIHRDSIDYSVMDRISSDETLEYFSYERLASLYGELPCYLTYTNERTHTAIRNSLSESPMFTGLISGRGPRYCPSVEDKVVRFASKERHQIILEPEGTDSEEVYINGFSTSLPENTQEESLRSIRGLENAHILKFGYAVEYDYAPPDQIARSMETKTVRNLFLAGQINGTTGYEEAGAQGLVAGINAARRIHDASVYIPARSESYIGVLIDDLITKGADEPYRMFTSRAEYRLLLRHDNAHRRLSEKAHSMGLIDARRYRAVCEESRRIEVELERLKRTFVVYPRDASGNERFSLFSILSRPETHAAELYRDYPTDVSLGAETLKKVEVEAKYAGYITKQRLEIERQKKIEQQTIPKDFDYTPIKALSNEAREKLARIRPETLGQAARIFGVNPADMSVLAVFLERYRPSGR
jgi:tRNA uridine 5-carboxymethylaminomethyl modification enzyme